MTGFVVSHLLAILIDGCVIFFTSNYVIFCLFSLFLAVY